MRDPIFGKGGLTMQEIIEAACCASGGCGGGK